MSSRSLESVLVKLILVILVIAALGYALHAEFQTQSRIAQSGQSTPAPTIDPVQQQFDENQAARDAIANSPPIQ